MDSLREIFSRAFQAIADRVYFRAAERADIASRHRLGTLSGGTASLSSLSEGTVLNVAHSLSNSLRATHAANTLRELQSASTARWAFGPDYPSGDTAADNAAAPSPTSGSGRGLSQEGELATIVSDAANSMVRSISLATQSVETFGDNASRMAEAAGKTAQATQQSGDALAQHAQVTRSVSRSRTAPRGFRTLTEPDGQTSEGTRASLEAASAGQETPTLAAAANAPTTLAARAVAAAADALRSVSSSAAVSGQGDNTAASPPASAFDRFLARTMATFRRMSRSGRESWAATESTGDNGETRQTPESNRNARLPGIRLQLTRSIGRLGRRILNQQFRQQVRRGTRQLAHRRATTAAGSPGTATATGQPAGILGRLFGGVGGGTAGAAGSGGTGAGGAAAGAGGLSGAVITGGLILGLVALIAVLAVTAKALYELGTAGYQTALRVAQFDGALSAAKTQLDVGRMLRDIQTANTLSGSGSRFMSALNDLEATLRPITDVAMRIGLEFLVAIVNSLVFVLRILLTLLAQFAKMLDLIVFGLIPDDAIKALDDLARGNQRGPGGVAQAGFHDIFRNRPIAPPRAPLPGLGN